MYRYGSCKASLRESKSEVGKSRETVGILSCSSVVGINWNAIIIVFPAIHPTLSVTSVTGFFMVVLIRSKIRAGGGGDDLESVNQYNITGME